MWSMLPVAEFHAWLLLLFSHPVLSDSFRSHGLQHTRPLCPLTSPKVCPSSCPLHQWCHPAISSSEALFLFLPSIFPSIRDFSNELSVCIRWPKYWSFSFSISPSNEYSGLISFRKGQSVPGHKSIQNGNNSHRTQKLASLKRKECSVLVHRIPASLGHSSWLVGRKQNSRTAILS